MVKSDDKVGGGAGLRTLGVLAGAVALAVGLTACGGGGGGGSSSTPTVTTGSATQTGNATISTPTVSGTTSSASTVGFELTVKNAAGATVNNATVVVTKADKTTTTFTASSGVYSATLSTTDIASTSTVVITVALDGHKTATVNFATADLVAGNMYSSTIQLAKADTYALSVPTMSPSSVYIGDGKIPADKANTNKFSSTTPVGLVYSVDLGAMPSWAEGYASLVVTAQIRGVDGYSCPGDFVKVYQVANGVRVNETTVVRLAQKDASGNAMDATTADPAWFDVTVPGNKFKASVGNLYAEFGVNNSLCLGGTEYDDLEFAAVSAKFSN